MPQPHLILPVSEELQGARDLFLVQTGVTAVQNTHLWIALAALLFTNCASVSVLLNDRRTAREPQVVIVRINDAGRTETSPYSSTQFRAQEPEIKYFLIKFVNEHYGRRRATLKDAFARSLYFLEGRLAEEALDQIRKTNAFEPYLSGQADEVDIQVKNVVIEDPRRDPYRAMVEFDKVYRTPATGAEVRRERFVASFLFTINPHVTNEMIPVNPLGFVINFLHEDQAFQRQP